MMETTDERLIDKIRKLIAHEASARKIGNIAEAAAFAERIHRLLIQHKLSLSEIEASDARPAVEQTVHFATKEQFPMRRKVERFYQDLFGIVAEAHFCRSIPVLHYNMIYLIGREEDRAIAIAMFNYLYATMKRLASPERREVKARRRSVRNFRSSFYRGFISAVHWRYVGMRAKADVTESTALVLRRSDDEVKARFAEMHPNTVKLARGKLDRVNSTARDLGRLHGRKVSLTPNVMGSGSDPKLLSD